MRPPADGASARVGLVPFIHVTVALVVTLRGKAYRPEASSGLPRRSVQ